MSSPPSIIIQGLSVDELRAMWREDMAETHAPKAGHVVVDRRGIATALGVGLDTVDKLRREGMPTLMVIESPRFEVERVLEWLRGRAK